MSESTSSVSGLSEELTKCNEKLHLAGSLGLNLLDDKRKLEEEMTILKNQYSKLFEVTGKCSYRLCLYSYYWLFKIIWKRGVSARSKCNGNVRVAIRSVYVYANPLRVGLSEGETWFAAEAVGSQDPEGLQDCWTGGRSERIEAFVGRVRTSSRGNQQGVPWQQATTGGDNQTTHLQLRKGA